MPKAKTLIPLQGVAEISGVAQSTVSNWRRRYDDFPQPKAKNDQGRPLFALTEVRSWLASTGRVSEGDDVAVHLFGALDQLRGEMDSSDAALTVCALAALSASTRNETEADGQAQADLGAAIVYLSGRERLRRAFTNVRETPAARSIFADLSELSVERLAQLFESALDGRDWQYDSFRTPRLVIDLVARLVRAQQGVESVFDPAGGSCELLLAAAGAAPPDTSMTGQDIRVSEWQLGLQRVLIADKDVDYRLGDSLMSDQFPGEGFDVVVCDPPFNEKNADALPVDDRWLLGRPAGRADAAWLEHCLAHVNPGGMALVVQAARSLFSGGHSRDVRRELLRRGLLEAVIELPGALRRDTRLKTVLWVLRGTQDSVAGSDVLLASIDEAPKSDEATVQISDGVVSLVDQWRRREQIVDVDGVSATAVSPLELLDDEVSLSPSRWIHPSVSVEQAERWKLSALEAPERLTALFLAGCASNDNAKDAATNLPGPIRGWTSVGDLAKQRMLVMLRSALPRHVKNDAKASGSVELVRIQDLVPQDAPVPSFVDPDMPVAPDNLTKVGDVLVAPGGAGVRAWIEEKGGRAPLAPLRGLRIEGDWITPRVLRFAVESDHNKALAEGSAVMRVPTNKLEIPVLSSDQVQALDEWLALLDEADQLAAKAHTIVSDARLGLSMLISADGIGGESA